MAEDKSTLRVLREAYVAVPQLRALAHLPHLGAAIDVLLEGGVRIEQEARVEDTLRKLHMRLQRLERFAPKVAPAEFAELISDVLEKAARARSPEKRARFAEILAHKLETDEPWEEADAAVQLLADLDGIHIQVLHVALNAPLEEKSWHDHVVTLIDDAPEGTGVAAAVSLARQLPGYSQLALRMAATQLVSRGLLKDLGVGRGLGTGAMEVLAASDLAHWFARWIGEGQKDSVIG